MKRDRKEWQRFMNRPPKKEKKVKAVEDEKTVEKVLINGDEELFAELCMAEETIKKLKDEIRATKEHYENKYWRRSSLSDQLYNYALNFDTYTATAAQQQATLEREEARRRHQQVQYGFYGNAGTTVAIQPDPEWATNPWGGDNTGVNTIRRGTLGTT